MSNVNANQSALEAYMANTSLSSIEEIEEAWRLAGEEFRDATGTVKKSRETGGPLEIVLKSTMDLAAQGVIDVPEKKPGKRPDDYVPTHVDRLVANFLAMGASEVTEGTGSHRNMLNTVQSVLRYAAKDKTALETVQKALSERDTRRAADKKDRVEGGIRIMAKLAKAAKDIEYKKPLGSDAIKAAIDKKAAKSKAWVDYVAKFVTDAVKHPDADESEAWADVVSTINAYVQEQRDAADAEVKAETFADAAIAAAKTGVAKVNKNGTVTLKLTPEQLAKLQLA